MASPEPISSKYRFELATERRQEEYFLSSWRGFLTESESQDKIYQTPEFFNFLLKTSDGKERVEIFSITKTEDETLAGIVPIRIRNEEFSFKIGAKKLASRKMKVIGLLGSMPLVSAEFDMIERLFNYLFQQFHECQAICMSALPSSSILWTRIQNLEVISRKFCNYVADDWRECHTIPLFSSFDIYLKQFNTKKRYNLNRQIRLLREHCGSLSLRRIREASEVHLLTSAINELVPAARRNIFLSADKCKALADSNLLLCYVLDCGAAPGALIFGTCSSHVFHVHNILYSRNLPEFSIGTTILHLAIEDLTTHFNFSSIDLGYGVPGHAYQSSNKKKERAYVLTFPNTMKNRCLCWLHKQHNNAVNFAKKIVKNIN